MFKIILKAVKFYNEISIELYYLSSIKLEIFLQRYSPNQSLQASWYKFPKQLCYCLHMPPLEDCPSLGITLTFRDYFLTALSSIDSSSNSSVVATFTAIGTSKSRGVFYFGILWLYSIALEINLNQIKLPPERIANIIARTHLV